MRFVTFRTGSMSPPRQIYSSSLSRRDRAWGRTRRRSGGYLVARLTAASVLTTSVALVLPRLAG